MTKLLDVSLLLRIATISACFYLIQSPASATELVANRAPIVSLKYDKSTQTLWKATPKMLARSTNYGRSWTVVEVPSTAQGRITTFTISARDPNVLYLGGPKIGVARSRDRGQKWDAGNSGLPSRKIVALASHSDQAMTVYAYIKEKGIFRSQDGGATWRLMDRGPRGAIVDFVHTNMPGSMETGWLFAAKTKGMGRSMDCFCGWHNAGEVSGAFNAVSYDPDQPQNVYAASREGLFVSTDGGEQWSRVTSPKGKITALTVVPGKGVYAASDGNLIRSVNNGITWETIDE